MARQLTGEEERDNRVFKALANPDRRLIMDLLRENRMSTGDLCSHFPELNRCTVMQHLGVLNQAGLVISKKDGRMRWHYLDIAPVQRIHERWIRAYSQPASALLLRLKEQIEGA